MSLADQPYGAKCFAKLQEFTNKWQNMASPSNYPPIKSEGRPLIFYNTTPEPSESAATTLHPGETDIHRIREYMASRSGYLQGLTSCDTRRVPSLLADIFVRWNLDLTTSNEIADLLRDWPGQGIVAAVIWEVRRLCMNTPPGKKEAVFRELKKMAAEKANNRRSGVKKRLTGGEINWLSRAIMKGEVKLGGDDDDARGSLGVSGLGRIVSAPLQHTTNFARNYVTVHRRVSPAAGEYRTVQEEAPVNGHGSRTFATAGGGAEPSNPPVMPNDVATEILKELHLLRSDVQEIREDLGITRPEAINSLQNELNKAKQRAAAEKQEKSNALAQRDELEDLINTEVHQLMEQVAQAQEEKEVAIAERDSLRDEIERMKQHTTHHKTTQYRTFQSNMSEGKMPTPNASTGEGYRREQSDPLFVPDVWDGMELDEGYDPRVKFEEH